MKPVRTCIGCRGTFGKALLLRYVSIDGRLAIDARGALPGRGAYTCKKQECLRAACSKKDAFSRALKQRVFTPATDDLIELMGSITRDHVARIKQNGSTGN